MQARQIHLRNRDRHEVFTRVWEADAHTQAPVRGVVHINHGMAEHGERYDQTAEALVAAGFVVAAQDHRGHGRSIHQGLPGHFADQDGWEWVVSDVDLVVRHLQDQYRGVPVFILGHSMGSFIVMQYLMKYRPTLAGAILSGSNYSPPLKYLAAGLIARLERLRQGGRGKSTLLRQLSFGSFNKGFKPARTELDWLSRNEAAVDAYIADPLCGFDCSNQLWIDLLGGLVQISRPDNLKRIPADLPLYIFGGSDDPVGSFGKGLSTLADKLRKSGHAQVDLKLYPQGRHEMLNETNRDEVVADLLGWLQRQAA